MAGIFTISPVNSIAFVRQEPWLPNYDNTLYQDKNEVGYSKHPYCQKINRGDTITIQYKTDYTVTCYLYNVATGAKTTITPVLKSTFTGFEFYEISTVFLANGLYKIFLSGTLAGYAPISYVSEMIQVADSWDGIRLDYYNDSNTAFVDYSTGIKHLLRVAGAVRFSDIGGKEEFYNNFGTEERIYAENETIYELTCEGIPYYLCSKILYGSKLDHFFVNDCEYLVKEHSVDPINGYLFNLTLKLTKIEVEGINEDYSTTEDLIIDVYVAEGETFTITTANISAHVGSLIVEAEVELTNISGESAGVFYKFYCNGIALGGYIPGYYHTNNTPKTWTWDLRIYQLTLNGQPYFFRENDIISIELYL